MWVVKQNLIGWFRGPSPGMLPGRFSPAEPECEIEDKTDEREGCNTDPQHFFLERPEVFSSNIQKCKTGDQVTQQPGNDKKFDRLHQSSFSNPARCKTVAALKVYSHRLVTV